MRVIRCEHTGGRRAFDGLPSGHHWGDLPSPACDGGYFMLEREVCAALEHTVNDWFPGWVRDEMRKKGYRFVVLEVPEEALCHAGEMQAVILREHCREVEEYVH